MNRLVRIIVSVIGCLHLCGGHWGVMQMVAWSRMMVDYSAGDGLLDGARKTFDGAHPCRLCTAIGEGKKKAADEGKDGKALSPHPVSKDSLSLERLQVPGPNESEFVPSPLENRERRALVRGGAPPLPPPRV